MYSQIDDLLAKGVGFDDSASRRRKRPGSLYGSSAYDLSASEPLVTTKKPHGSIGMRQGSASHILSRNEASYYTPTNGELRPSAFQHGDVVVNKPRGPGKI